MKVLTVLTAATGAAWGGTHALMAAPPPVLDMAMMACTGLWFAYTAWQPPTEEKSPVTMTAPRFSKSSDQYVKEIQALKDKMTPIPDAAGTFYCQAGDHIVDHIVWLETITLGCRPCMEKLGRSISTDDWMPRLWTVTKDGAKRARDISRPKPKTAAPAPPVKNYFTCDVCRTPFEDMSNGFFNTSSGYTCATCAGAEKLGQSKTTGAQRNSQRRAKIVERQSEQIERQKREAVDVDTWARTLREVLNPPIVSRSVFRDGGGPPVSSVHPEYGNLYDPEELFQYLERERIKRENEQRKAELLAQLTAEAQIPPAQMGRRWPKHRDAELAPIADRITCYARYEDCPTRGRDGEIIYVTETDEAYLWRPIVGGKTGWIRIALKAPPQHPTGELRIYGNIYGGQSKPSTITGWGV